MIGLFYEGDHEMVFEVVNCWKSAKDRIRDIKIYGCNKITIFDYDEEQGLFLEYAYVR